MPCIPELFIQTITERPLKIPNGGQFISPAVGIFTQFQDHGEREHRGKQKLCQNQNVLHRKGWWLWAKMSRQSQSPVCKSIQTLLHC